MKRYGAKPNTTIVKSGWHRMTANMPSAAGPPIYLDFNASTPVAPEVRDAMTPLLSTGHGNPSSTHWAGQPARRALELARADVASLIGASPDEVVFTSGGSEANNAALKGVFFSRNRSTVAPHIITTLVEHPAILVPCKFLESLGARVTYLPVDRSGLVDPGAVQAAITPDTVLVTVMHANNEVGTVEPITEIAEFTRAHGILFHTDAAQSVGKIPTRVTELGVDLLSIAGHKLYAPKGVGALYIRSGVMLEPFVHGGGQERGRRAGTESALLAVGLGAACRLASDQPCAERLGSLTAHFWSRLESSFGAAVVMNGHPTARLPNTLNVSFPGHVGQDILGALEGVAASTGSACHAGATVMPPVLTAMGLDEDVGRGAVRFSLGRETTQNEIDTVVELLETAVFTSDALSVKTRDGGLR